MRLEVGKIYKMRNGLDVLIEDEEGVFSDRPWDFTGRDTTFKKYYHFRTNGRAYEGDNFNIEEQS